MNDIAVVEREQEEKDALQKVQGWIVKTAEEYSALDNFLVGLAALKKRIVADFAESKEKTSDAKRAATVAHKAVCDQEDGHIGIIEEARRLGKQKLTDYEEAQKRELERLQAIADAKAKKEAEDRALELASLAEKGGDKEAAEAIMAEPPKMAPRLVSAVPERSTVVSTRWFATIGGTRQDSTKSDPLFVLKAIETACKFMDKAKTPEGKAAADLLRQAKDDIRYMVYDQVSLNRKATADKDAFRLGGVSFNPRKI